MIFAEKTFTDCLLVPPTDATAPNFMRKTFMKVFCYTVFTVSLIPRLQRKDEKRSGNKVSYAGKVSVSIHLYAL